MLIAVDFNSDTPIYEQLKQQIVIGIASGNLKPGEKLPSIRQMAEDLGVNLHTINKAYNQLKADGLLAVDRRKGAVVASPPKHALAKQKVQLMQTLKPLVAKAICYGFSKDEMQTVCNSLYDQITGGNDE